MVTHWLQDIESFEAISQNHEARQIFLRMAAMTRTGQLPSFLSEVVDDEDLDEQTKGTLVELAKDEAFLLAVEDYLRQTQLLH